MPSRNRSAPRRSPSSVPWKDPRATGDAPEEGSAPPIPEPPTPQAPPACPRPSRIAIIGSRDFSNPKLVAETMDPYLPHVELVVSGGADGGDKLGARWARKNGVETLVFQPDHKRYKHPYHHRNRLIAEACDLVVAFWNGRSTGTAYTVAYAKKLGKPVRVVRY